MINILYSNDTYEWHKCPDDQLLAWLTQVDNSDNFYPSEHEREQHKEVHTHLKKCIFCRTIYQIQVDNG